MGEVELSRVWNIQRETFELDSTVCPTLSLLEFNKIALILLHEKYRKSSGGTRVPASFVCWEPGTRIFGSVQTLFVRLSTCISTITG